MHHICSACSVMCMICAMYSIMCVICHIDSTSTLLSATPCLQHPLASWHDVRQPSGPVRRLHGVAEENRERQPGLQGAVNTDRIVGFCVLTCVSASTNKRTFNPNAYSSDFDIRRLLVRNGVRQRCRCLIRVKHSVVSSMCIKKRNVVLAIIVARFWLAVLRLKSYV